MNNKRSFSITVRAKPVLQIVTNLNRWRVYRRASPHHYKPKRQR